jgi:hypothetical protein
VPLQMSHPSEFMISQAENVCMLRLGLLVATGPGTHRFGKCFSCVNELEHVI